MLSFKELREKRMAVSADYKISASGRKVHKMKKIADTEDDRDDKEDDKEDKEVKEGAVPAHMQGKQKPYVSSDGKGNYEVLGNRGHTKATFTRAEHGKDAHKKAQDHLKAKYNEYMKEDVQLDENTVSKIAKEHGFVKQTSGVDKGSYKHPQTGHTVTALSNGQFGHSAKDGSTIAVKPTSQMKDHLASKGYKKTTNESVETIDEVLDMRHHTTGTGSIHVSHTHTSPSRVHSIGYTDAHKISQLKSGEKHEYKNANGHETFTAHKQSDGSTKIHDNRGTHVATIKNKMDKYSGPVKEEVEMFDEAVDKQEQRFLQLARLGLVDKSNVSKLRIAVDQLKADKLLTVQQRTLLLGVMMDLVDLVTGDDAVFQRVKMDVQKEATDPCWKNYKMVGMKDKNGKKVPNCVPKESTDVPFDGPYTKTPEVTTDKSGAKHTPQSRVRHLARLALKKQQDKVKSKE